MNVTNQSNKTFRNVKELIYLFGCTNIIIENCFAVHAVECTNIYVVSCKSVNPGRNFVQFDKVTGGMIANNHVLNSANPLAEDSINIYQSNNIIISGNTIIRGGNSNSGSGIMLGDNGGSNIFCFNNRLVNTGQCGIGIAGGDFITVLNNKVFGDQSPISNVGIYAWGQEGVPCSNIFILRNRVNWKSMTGAQNGFWSSPNVTGLIEDNNNWSDKTVLPVGG